MRQATGLEDLAAWQAAKGRHLRFLVGKNSSFALAVEGMALSVLRELQLTSRIEVECSFDVLAAAATGGQAAQLGVLDGLFGLALVSSAQVVRVAPSSFGRAEVLDCLWHRVRAARGAIGDGKRMSLVSRDPDDPIPECLRGPSAGFPKRDRFGTVLFEQARAMGAIRAGVRGGYSRSENDAITFLFEAARNSFEHARSDETGSAIQGIRGIVVAKAIFASLSEVRARQDFLDVQKDYLERVWGELGVTKRVTAYTVADLGRGIHATLRPLSTEETPWQRLLRAFEPGQTRKAKGTDVEAGMGLPRLRAAAERLRALLIVKSGCLLGIADFSAGPGAQGEMLTPWSESLSIGDCGTSITLVWPETDGAGDQGRLF